MPNLIACTAKKSVSVAGKVLFWGFIGIATLAITSLIVAVASKFVDPLRNTLVQLGSRMVEDCKNMFDAAGSVFGNIITWLAGLPAVAHLIWITVVAIVGYSFLWCLYRDIQKELTMEDYVSGRVNHVVDVLCLYILVGAVVIALAGLVIVSIWNVGSTLLFAAIFFIMITFCAFGVITCYDEPHIIGNTTRNRPYIYFIVRAPIAYIIKRREATTNADD